MAEKDQDSYRTQPPAKDPWPGRIVIIVILLAIAGAYAIARANGLIT